jgi:hypothetical protein
MVISSKFSRNAFGREKLNADMLIFLLFLYSWISVLLLQLFGAELLIVTRMPILPFTQSQVHPHSESWFNASGVLPNLIK